MLGKYRLWTSVSLFNPQLKQVFISFPLETKISHIAKDMQ